MLDLRLQALLLVLVLAISVSRFASPSSPDNQDRSVLGRWKIVAALDGSRITSLDEHEARSLVGKVVSISTDGMRFGARRCLPPDLDAEKVEPRLYLRKEAHASAAKLGLPNPVTVVNLGCTIAFIKAKDRIVIHWDGWFFDADRQR